MHRENMRKPKNTGQKALFADDSPKLTRGIQYHVLFAAVCFLIKHTIKQFKIKQV